MVNNKISEYSHSELLNEEKKKRLLEKIKNGEIKKIQDDDPINLDDLMALDESGVSYLEHFCNNRGFASGFLPQRIESQIAQNNDAISTCIKARNVSLFFSPFSSISAQALITLAKNRNISIINVIPELLLFKGSNDSKSVLENLIEIDQNLTLDTIVTPELLKNNDIVFLLNSLGIQSGIWIVRSDEKSYSDELLKDYNENYDNDVVGNCDELLEEFYNLFCSDGKSDKELINLLVKSYRVYANNNEEFAKLEIDQLMEIKRNFPEFAYKKSNSGSRFTRDEGCVYCSEPYYISHINHETSHALHHYLADYDISKNFEEIIKQTKSNPVFLEKFASFARSFSLKRDNMYLKSRTQIQDDVKQNFDINSLEDFLSSSKQEQKEKYKNDYSEEFLDIILNKFYSKEEYIEQYIDIEAEKICDTLIETEYSALCAIDDIYDAMYYGEYMDQNLRDTNENFILGISGHGSSYYKDMEKCFSEMIADFGEIYKNVSDTSLEYLRVQFGNELVDMLQDFYENKILKSNRFTKKEEEDNNYAR